VYLPLPPAVLTSLPKSPEGWDDVEEKHISLCWSGFGLPFSSVHAVERELRAKLKELEPVNVTLLGPGIQFGAGGSNGNASGGKGRTEYFVYEAELSDGEVVEVVQEVLRR